MTGRPQADVRRVPRCLYANPPAALSSGPSGRTARWRSSTSASGGVPVGALVTFVPDAAFRAHPRPVLAGQAASRGLAHHIVPIEEPYETSCRHAFEDLIAGCFTRFVTGDIDRVAGMPNRVRQCAEGLDVEVVTPLWGRDREGASIAWSRRP